MARMKNTTSIMMPSQTLWTARATRPGSARVASLAAIVLLSAACEPIRLPPRDADIDANPEMDSGADGMTPDGSPALQWYRTCGQPVCGGYMPTMGATVCTGQQVGQTCSPQASSCEIPNDACNADLLCTDQDPATNCPISQARWKRDIHYLDRGELTRIANELLATRLARYVYRADAPGAAQTGRDGTATAPRLGFIIDDLDRDSPAVRPGGERVDLYGYTSMAVAAIKIQAETIRQLQQEIAELRAEMASLRQNTTATPRRTNR